MSKPKLATTSQTIGLRRCGWWRGLQQWEVNIAWGVIVPRMPDELYGNVSRCLFCRHCPVDHEARDDKRIEMGP